MPPRHGEQQYGVSMVQRWERLESEQVGDYDVFRVRRTTARSPRTGDVHEFHVLDVPRSVKVIALTDDDHVVLVEQYRQAVERVTLEFPAGLMEAGEDPVAAALRELEEETGYCAGSATVIAELDPDPAIQSNVVHVVVAHGCVADGRRDQDDGEDVAVRLTRIDEVPELIRRGAIRHAAAISAWYHFERSRSDPDATSRGAAAGAVRRAG